MRLLLSTPNPQTFAEARVFLNEVDALGSEEDGSLWSKPIWPIVAVELGTLQSVRREYERLTREYVQREDLKAKEGWLHWPYGLVRMRMCMCVCAYTGYVAWVFCMFTGAENA